MYANLLSRGPVQFVPGPAGYPGTSGVLGATGGYIVYRSPLPGQIIYQYRNDDHEELVKLILQELMEKRADDKEDLAERVRVTARMGPDLDGPLRDVARQLEWLGRAMAKEDAPLATKLAIALAAAIAAALTWPLWI